MNKQNITESNVYYIIGRNTKLARVGIKSIYLLTEEQVKRIDSDNIHFSTRDKAEQAISKCYQYDEQ